MNGEAELRAEVARLTAERDAAEGLVAGLGAQVNRLSAALDRVRALESHWRRHINANRCPSCQQEDGFCDHEEGYSHALAFLTEALEVIGRVDK